MNQIATTVEQSRKLLSLGLSPDTADMVFRPTMYQNENHITLEVRHDPIADGETPAWSLSALISLLPVYRYNKDEITHFFTVEIYSCNWNVCYRVPNLFDDSEGWGESLFDALISLIEQLKKQYRL